MARSLPALLAALLLLPAGAGRAADGPTGSWKLTLPGSNLTILFQLEDKGGKLAAQTLGSTVPEFTKVAISDVAATADSLRLTLKLPSVGDVQFDGKLPADPKTGKIAGSLLVRGKQLLLIQLEPSKLKTFDKYEFNKESLEQATDPAALLDAALDLAAQAGEKKAKIEEVRGWADKAFKPAENYGVRWQRTAAMRLAQAASGLKEYAPVAVEYARKAERLLDPDDEPGVQMEVLDTVAQVLIKADKADDAKQIIARLAKLEDRDYAEYFKKLPVKTEAFAGRKSKSERAVLVELFTSSALEQSPAAEAAFAALERTYKPGEVVLVQYHLHVADRAPDVLGTPDSIERVQYFEKKFRGLPSLFVNGKSAAPGGGALAAAQKKYGEYREVVDALLEKDADAKLQLEATRKGNVIAVKATYSDLAKTGETVRLRFALVESHMRSTAGGQRYHHAVVRAILGGAKGVALTKKSGDQSATANVEEIRVKLGDYLDKEEFAKTEQPLGLKNLRVIAFIQDDDGNEVLQAAQVDVK